MGGAVRVQSRGAISRHGAARSYPAAARSSIASAKAGAGLAVVFACFDDPTFALYEKELAA